MVCFITKQTHRANRAIAVVAGMLCQIEERPHIENFAKLSSNSVLVLEAGPPDTILGSRMLQWKIHMPAALMYNLCDDKYNWYYNTVPQKHCNNRVRFFSFLFFPFSYFYFMPINFFLFC